MTLQPGAAMLLMAARSRQRSTGSLPEHALKAEVRLYDYLFAKATPGEESGDFKTDINPNSLEVLKNCFVEPGLAGAEPGSRYQFERLGYFCIDPDSSAQELVFNRIVTLKDTWAKVEKTIGKARS